MTDRPHHIRLAAAAKLCLVLAGLLACFARPPTAGAQTELTVDYLDPDRHQETFGMPMLFSGWKYSPGDHPEWAAADFDDGAWAVLAGASPLTSTSLTLSVLEDQIGDSEQVHISERVAYLVFGSAPE